MGIEQIINQPAVAVVILLGSLIFFHELGHFLVGRFCGVGIEVFSIGFGPSILKFTHKNTRYQISLIPLGGYVKFAGSLSEEPVAEVFRGQEFFNASRLKRAAIIAAGPGANFLLAIFCYACVAQDGIPQYPAFIGQVRSGSPADQVGIQSQDIIVEINDKPISYWSELQETIALSPVSKPLKLGVKRGEETLHFVIEPGTSEVEDETGKLQKQNIIGVGLEYILPVVTITGNSIAHRAGFRTGMIIDAIKFDGVTKTVTGSDDLFVILDQARIDKFPVLTFVAHLGDEQSENHEGLDAKSREIALEIASWSDDSQLNELTSKERGKLLAKFLGIYDSQLTLKNIKADSLKSLLRPYDRLISFNGKILKDVYSLGHALDGVLSAQATLEVDRDGIVTSIEVPLQSYEVQKASGKALAYYLDVEMLGERKAPSVMLQKFGGILPSFGFGISQTVKHSGMIVGGIYNLITGNLPLKALGGPMMIAKVAGDSAKMGWKSYLGTMALISINLGVINLFPIPVLDGGQLLLIGAEAIKRRRLEPKAIENFQKIGFVLLFSLVILSLYNDLSRFWASLLAGLKGLF